MQQLTNMTSNSQTSYGRRESSSASYQTQTRPPTGFEDITSENWTNTLNPQQSGDNNKLPYVQPQCGPESSGFWETSSENGTNTFSMHQSGMDCTPPYDQTQNGLQTAGLGESYTRSTKQNKNDLKPTSVQILSGPEESGFEELNSANENERLSEQRRENDSEVLFHQLQDNRKTSGFGEFSSEIVTNTLTEQQSDINFEPSSRQLHDNLVKSRSRELSSENKTNTSNAQHNTSVSTISFDQNQFGPGKSGSWKSSSENGTNTPGAQQNENTFVTSLHEPRYSQGASGFGQLLSENRLISINSQGTASLSNHLEDGPLTSGFEELSSENWTNSLNEQRKENGACPSCDQIQDDPVTADFEESSSEKGTSDSTASSGQHQSSLVASAHSTIDIRSTLINASDSDSTASSGQQLSTSESSAPSTIDIQSTLINASDSDSTASSDQHQSSVESSAHSTIDIQSTLINASDSDSTASSDQHQSSVESSAPSTIDRQSTVVNGSHTEYTHPQDETTDEAVSVGDFNSTEVKPTIRTDPSGLQSSHYLHAESFQVSDSGTGTQLFASLLKRSESVDCGDMDVPAIVSGLTNPDWHRRHMSLREALLLERLPRALETQNMADAAECLTACDPDVQDRAVSCLEQLLLMDRNGYKSAKELSKVMAAIISTIHGDHGDASRLQHNIYLFLLAACALLLPHHLSPSHPQESVSVVQEKLCNTLKDYETQGSKVTVRKLKEISQIFNDMIKAVLPDGSRQMRLKWTRQMFLQLTDKELKRADMGILVLCFHSLICEMCKVGWSPTIGKLASRVNRILQEVSRRKLEENTRLTFDVFTIRSLASVLNTDFNEDRQNVKGRTSDAPIQLVALVNQIVLKSNQKKTLLEELTLLHFHPCGAVCQIIRDLMTRCDLQLAETILKYIDTRVRLAGIQVCYDLDLSSENKTKEDQQASCKWVEKKCMDNSGVKLLVAFYLPKPSCLGRGAMMKCMQKHFGEHRHNQLHENNLEFLLSIKPHQNFLTLHAFQIHPMPSFYITEDVSESRLLHLLLDRRETHQWLPSNILCQAALDVVSPLDFLDRQRIVLRDITTYNMKYNLQERQTSQTHKDLVSVRVKIANLGLANRSCSESESRNIVTIAVFDAGPVPTRWTSVEALCYGEFSSKSMVYALGYVLYELFTHGCQPFSEMQGKSTEDILMLVVTAPECTRPFRWACFPPDIFNLVRDCTTQVIGDRPSLPQIKEKLKECLKCQASCKPRIEILSLKHQSRIMKNYPLLDIMQTERNHVPETGIPSCIGQLINGDPKHKKVFLTDCKMKKTKKVNKNEDSSLDPITIYPNNDQVTIVYEVLTPAFVKSFLPVLQTSALEGVVCWTYTRIFPQPHHFTQERHYECLRLPLADVARRRSAMPFGEEDQSMFLHTFLAIAKCVRNMHEKSWLHRDLRAANIFITRDTGKVILVRIGRMVHSPEPGFTREKEVDLSASLRWLSPEALHLSVYTKENDIFMLGTTIWETYNIRQVCYTNPTATKLDLVPFPDKTMEEVVSLIQKGVHPTKVPDMPEWLYKLACDCRHPDKEERPNISDVITRLEERYSKCLSTEVSVSSHGSRCFQTYARCYSESDLGTHKHNTLWSATKKNTVRIFRNILKKKRAKGVKTRLPSMSESTKRNIERTSSLVDDYASLADVSDYQDSLSDNRSMSVLSVSSDMCQEYKNSVEHENGFQYEEKWCESKTTYSQSTNLVSQRSAGPRLPQRVGETRNLRKHRRGDQLLPSLPPRSSCRESPMEADDRLTSKFSQHIDDKKNSKLSSWGDEISPLHLKHRDRSKRNGEEDDKEEDTVKNDTYVPLSLCETPGDFIFSAAVGNCQEEVAMKSNGDRRKCDILRPAPSDWGDNHIYLPHSYLQSPRAADLTDLADYQKKDFYLTPVPDDWWDKHPALTLSRSSSS